MSLNKIVLGNWKMNKTFNEIKLFCKDFNILINNDEELKKSDTVIGIAPSYLGIIPFSSENKTKCLVLAQNVSAKESGAFTSQVSVKMLKELNVHYILLGHSEVRQYLKETDSDINNKVSLLLKEQVKPVLCIGETLQQFEANQTNTIIENQLKDDLANIKNINPDDLIIAYEPIWAIGTGKTATTDIIAKVHGCIRNTLVKLFGETGKGIHILYGGSVNEKNAKEIMNVDNVDGVLVGGASMNPKQFYTIIKSA